MNKNIEFNQKLIDAIKHAHSKKNDQIGLLMQTLCVGKEAAYRRLRGEVHFTFAEACKLSKLLSISLNDIAQSGKYGMPVFELKTYQEEFTGYDDHKLAEHDEALELIMNGSVLSMMVVCITIPYVLFLSYDNLAKYRFFKWVYQAEKKLVPSKFADISIPEELRKRQRDTAEKRMYLPENTFIFDRDMFATCCNEFKYFHNLGLISDEELGLLKKELLEALQDLETFSVRGRNEAGNHTWIYLSNIAIDSNYTYIKGKDFEFAFMDGIYIMDSIVSTDPQVCRMHREWIESLRKYSTLISVSGEIERKEFFREQRKLITEI